METTALVSSGLDLQASFTDALQGLGLSANAARLLWLPLPMVTVLVAAVVGVLVNVWLERKISAAVQQRIGPEFAGPLGVLQPMADGLKLVFKEDIIPARADGLLFPGLEVFDGFGTFCESCGDGGIEQSGIVDDLQAHLFDDRINACCRDHLLFIRIEQQLGIDLAGPLDRQVTRDDPLEQVPE